MKTFRWGIVGVGDVCEVKSGPAMYKSENSELVAVMRRSGDKAKDFAERHGVPRWYDDADALINDPEVDVVYIATPQYAHKEYTIKAAQAGKPVYVEKPMALTGVECQQMLSACKKAGVPIWVAFYRRPMPRFLKMKELIDSGAIGDVLTVSITLHLTTNVKPNTPLSDLFWVHDPALSNGGIVMDMSCHQIDLMHYWFGDFAAVSGYATNLQGLSPVPDTASASFRFESGVIGSGIWNTTAASHVDQTVVTGTKGKLTFATFAPSPFTLENTDGVQTFDIGYPEHVHQPLVESIIAELNGQGTCSSTGDTAIHTNRFLDQMLASYR